MQEASFLALLFAYSEVFLLPTFANPAHIVMDCRMRMVPFIVVDDVDRVDPLDEPSPDRNRSFLLLLRYRMQITFIVNIAHIS